MLVRDPVHGDLSLSRRETAVLDTAAVQRLRGIKQLGTAFLVYPGALHTRFDHSLGAAAVARRIVRSLDERGFAVDADLAEGIVAAALLHDVTHVPFGHTLEDERRLFARHDKGQRLVRLLDGDLGAALRRLDLFELVTALLGVPGATAVPRWAAQIVSSTIDADLLDYLRRDAYFAGLAAGYDDRVFRQFVIDGDELAVQLEKHGMERADARSETLQLLRVRYFLTERVYYHHTKVAAGAMISRAVELAHTHGVLGEAELLCLSDGGLFERLRALPDERPRSLIERIERRDLFKRAYAISARTVTREQRSELVRRFHETAGERAEAERRLASVLGCDPAAVVVYCPALTFMKEAAVAVCTPHGTMPLNRYDSEAGSEVAALERNYERLWRFFVFVPREHVSRAGPAAAEYFGFPNEHASQNS